MSIVEMQKIHIVSILQYKDEILSCLQKNEVLDIQNISETKKKPLSSEEIGKYEFELAEIKSALAFLEGILQKKKSFIEAFVPPKEEITESEFIQTCQEFNCSEIIEKCEKIETRLANLKNLKIELQAEVDKLLPWQNLDFPLDNLARTVRTNIIVGKIKHKPFREFKNKIEKLTDAFHLEVANQTKEAIYLVMAYLIAEEKVLADLLSKSEFERISLPKTQRTPQEEIYHLRSLLKKAEEETKELLNEAKNLARYLNKLSYMHDFILGKKDHLEIKQKLEDTDYTFIIEGWVKKEDSSRLKKELSKITSEFEIYPIKPAEGESIPIAIKNPKVLSPFELVTKIFALPKPSELDPTFALAFFFALFFGICLGDFGYGLVLTVFCLYFMKKYKLPQGGKNLFLLLTIGGVFSILAGILTGSYFGYTPAEVAVAFPRLKSLIISIQIIDPIKDPIRMLIVSLALGVIQIFFGMFLAMAQKIRRGRFLEAVIDDAFWIFFLAMLVFLTITSFVAPQFVKQAQYLSLAGAALLIISQGRSERNVIKKILSGTLSLYKVSSYLGDTLSYSRLLALGMTSAIIGSVINILAGMVKGVPIVGILLMIIILVFGHLFNLVISTLGAFVHSLRLQLVEFFGKFYEGGGREFKPYKRVAEYTILK